MKHLLMLFIIKIMVVVLALTSPGWAEAKQTSLDSKIIEAFENIDERTSTHEQDGSLMRDRLDKMAATLTDLRTKLSNLSSDSQDRNVHRQRRIIHGKIINMSAEYLNQSYKLLDSAAAVISANLSDLAKLAKAVRMSPDSKSSALKLQNRVQKNIGAGRSMRSALLRLRKWTKNNPDLTGRFQSLKRLTQALDRKITIDKARLESRHVDATGAVRGKRQDALERTVDRLGDMYVQVQSEKDSLRDLRDELSIAIQLGRMEMTQEVTERAIPRLDRIVAPSTGVNSLQDLASVIGELNTSMVAEANIPSPTVNSEIDASIDVGQPTKLKIGAFNNF